MVPPFVALRSTLAYDRQRDKALKDDQRICTRFDELNTAFEIDVLFPSIAHFSLIHEATERIKGEFVTCISIEVVPVGRYRVGVLGFGHLSWYKRTVTPAVVIQDSLSPECRPVFFVLARAIPIC